MSQRLVLLLSALLCVLPGSLASAEARPRAPLTTRTLCFCVPWHAARRRQQGSRLRKVLIPPEETGHRSQRTYSPRSVLSSLTPSETRRVGTRLTPLLSGLCCKTTLGFKPCVQRIFTLSDYRWQTRLCVKGIVLWQTQGMVVPVVSAFAHTFFLAPPAYFCIFPNPSLQYCTLPVTPSPSQ